MGTGRSVLEAKLIATVLRADGRREELGVVSYYHRNPLRRVWFRLQQVFKHLFRGQ